MLKIAAMATFLIFLLFAANALPEEACKSGKTGKPAAVTGKEAWDLASAAALKWKPDSRVFEIGTLSTGPMDDQGKATEWNIKFSSESAKAVNLISISQGSIRCWAMPGDGGRLIDFDNSIILDTKRLYDLAQKSGGEKYTAQKYKVSATLVQNPIGGALW